MTTMEQCVQSIIVLAAVTAVASATEYVTHTYSDPTNPGILNHLVVNKNSGKIYVGAVNRMYHLTEHLAEIKSISTGPIEDNPNCPPEGDCTCSSDCENYERIPLDSINKALTIDYGAGRLIYCTNLLQGHCVKRDLEDISNKDAALYTAIVSNDEVSSVVMFVAPGPIGGANVLYLGVTRSTEGLNAYKDLIPAISSRNLSNLRLASSGFTATKKELETQQRDVFRVDYIYGFSSGKFSYFLSVQKQSVEVATHNYVTRIIRVCQEDSNYYSYTEVPLECNHNGENYNILRAAHKAHPGGDLARDLGLSDIPPFSDMDDVLFALFSKSHPQSLEPMGDSVLCVFTLQAIRRTFTESIQNCFNGMGNTGPSHIVSPQPCVGTNFQIDDYYCGQHEINTPIAGTEAVSVNAVLFMGGTSATSIAVMVTYNYTVAFVGTWDGQLKKVVIQNRSTALEYETLSVDPGSAINSDMGFHHNLTHVYVMSEKKVAKVKVQECSQYTSCSACLGAQDPFCGWCVLDNQCSLRSECMDAEVTHRWLPYSGYQCPRIVEIIPDKVQITPNAASRLTLMVQNLPRITEGNYKCAYATEGTMPRLTSARRAEDQTGEITVVQCDTPSTNLIPPIPTGQDHIVMKLSVRMSDQNFVSRNFTFFDCGLHDSCTSCTVSDFPCTWCVQNHKCTHNRENCMNDVLITGQHVPGLTDRPGPQSCPRIEASFTEILVPSETQKQVKVQALNLQDFQSQFKCYFNVDGGREVNAFKREGDFIECDPVFFQYSSPTSPNINVPFYITWGEGDDVKALDNPDRIQVKVYKCEAMADKCGSCLILDPKYECGWCNNHCSIESQCDATRWLNSDEDCPDLIITSFEPQKGPRQGGTILTIEGENLGKSFDDIQGGIMVAGVSCIPDEDLYQPAVKVVCTTGESSSDTSGPVEITIRNYRSDSSNNHFSYVTPAISGFHPQKGPQSGGTLVTILGEHMNAGTTILATIVGLPCVTKSTSANRAVCQTQAISVSRAGLVEMAFDDARIDFTEETYRYVEDPKIVDVYRQRSILSGGLLVNVLGTNLDSVQYPKMYVNHRGMEFFGDCVVGPPTTQYECNATSPGDTATLSSESTTRDCTVKSTNEMTCHSPNIAALQEGGPQEEITLPYGFIMDSVMELRNLTAYTNGQRLFSFYPDPIFLPFEEGLKFFQPKNEYLTINGEKLNLVLTKDDVTVLIGVAHCNVTSIAETQLTCRPPMPETEGVGHDPAVTVLVGNLTFPIGTLQYESMVASLPMFSFPFILIFVAAGMLIIIILIVYIKYRQKSRENDRVMKDMQNQMDTLEAKVAKECKEAFAELQTDMTEMTSDLSGVVGIPFREYRSFCMQVLFPNIAEDEHPVTRYLEVEYSRRDHIHKGLDLFNQLILNKTFLLLFIRTLEEHKDFSMRERVNVASLISVALQNRMEYHTDILKTLLSELIEKAMEGRSHPKLLLRRTESVAEKMLTNWFTFLLYKFMKECAGEPLYMLYRAIKQQIDKGPVDGYTSEAKYSLSEDKLIRQQIDYKVLTIFVVDADIQYGTQEHIVKVLDCDTISQVKEKMLDAINKNAPFSVRPDKDDLELEWHAANRGHVILQDEDHTTRMDGEFRRVNTLAHYNVSDGAYMGLVPKQMSGFNHTLQSTRSASYHNMYGLSGSPSGSRSLSPRAIHLDLENGTTVKMYHLVKQHDSDMHKEGERGSKLVSEIYLTRLLATKGTLQQFVDDLIETIFSTANRGSALPLAIKYMFDFLDDQALHHGISDPEVVHTWKSNSLPLRFWVNVVKNPDFVFDIHKSNIVDSCLSVVAQTFMDSCSMSDHRLGKDSPSSKLLYARDIPKYKKWVERYYQDIKMMPAISDQDMNAMLADESRQHQKDFNDRAALYELYNYVARYNNELEVMLQEDEFANIHRLPYRLQQVHNYMESCA